jgi:hypothetical protein
MCGSYMESSKQDNHNFLKSFEVNKISELVVTSNKLTSNFTFLATISSSSIHDILVILLFDCI